MTAPFIQTTIIGSYPVPLWLPVYPTRSHLKDAILVVLKTQELAGLDLISDGELGRFDINHPETNGMIDYFVKPLKGIETSLSHEERQLFRNQYGMGFRKHPSGIVRSTISEGSLDLQSDYLTAAQTTTRPVKFAVTSPYMLAKTLLNHHYRNMEELTWAIANVLRCQISRIDAPFIQIDEAHLPGSIDDSALAADTINHIVEVAPHQTGVHLCFGNYGGQTIQEGHYEKLLPFFNTLQCDFLLLEFARRNRESIELFQDLKPSLRLGIGVIDIKDLEIETPEIIARRIEHAVQKLGAERVHWIHPDCGFWMLPRTVADQKMQALVKGRDLFCQ